MASNSAVDLTSDETNAMICSMCKEENKSTVAVKYCVDCQAFYCSDCLKSHKKLPGLKSHKLLDKDDDKIGQLAMIPTEKCERHHFKTVDMFCKNHDEVGCATCMAVDHRNCKDVHYIPEMMNTRNETECQQRLDIIEKKLNQFLDKFNDEENALQANKQRKIDNINAFAKKIEDKTKQAAHDAISQVELCYNKLKTSLKGNIAVVREKFETFSTVKGSIGTNKENKSQVFVASKLNKDKLVSIEEDCEKISQIELGQRVQFTIDPIYEKLFGENVVFGFIYTQPYRFMHKGSFDIKISSDETKTDVYGSCILTNGSIILADRKNKNIKLVDGTTLKVIHHHIFQSEPTDVCCVEGNRIAVCLKSEKKVSLFSVSNKFYPDADINLTFQCQGIFFQDKTFYISCSNKICLVDMSGNVFKTKAIDSNQIKNCSDLYFVFVSDKNKIILVSNNSTSSTGVISFNQDGKIQNTVSKEIVWAHAFADAGLGKVFACGYSSRNVVLLNERGEFENVVIKDGLSGPQALCFDLKRGRLYVSNYGKNEIEIFEAE